MLPKWSEMETFLKLVISGISRTPEAKILSKTFFSPKFLMTLSDSPDLQVSRFQSVGSGNGVSRGLPGLSGSLSRLLSEKRVLGTRQ